MDEILNIRRYRNRKYYVLASDKVFGGQYINFDEIIDAVKRKPHLKIKVTCSRTKEDITNTVLRGLLYRENFSDEEYYKLIRGQEND